MCELDWYVSSLFFVDVLCLVANVLQEVSPLLFTAVRIPKIVRVNKKTSVTLEIFIKAC